MLRYFVFLILIQLFGNLDLGAQSIVSSNLPIVIINTDNGGGIPFEPKVRASMKIIWHPDGSRNYISDQDKPEFINYNGRIGIEIRGSSSTFLNKKPYGLETRLADNTTANNVSILGMPAENDWVLNALAFDASMLRDHLSYELFRDMGHYAARSRYCEVILNGIYEGVYLFMEKLKGDDDRINIHSMTKDDNSGLDLTGGYIIKADKDNGDPISWTMGGPGSTAAFIHHEPEPEDITVNQKAYIKEQFMRLKDMTDRGDESLDSGYPNVIDVLSFMDFMLINEVSANVDGYQFSTYFFKDKGGKLNAGPVWDFNLTYGNDLFFWGFNRSFTFTWQFDNGDNTGPFFWKKLYEAPTFKCYLTKRWKQLTAPGQPLDRNRINEKINAITELLGEAAIREQDRWGTISSRLSNVAAMKEWLSERYFWMNNQLSSFSACANPNIPSLVISRIHYNPAGDQAGDLEFIEITNNGQLAVSTKGLFFGTPGMSYLFPVASIPSGQKIYLASNAIMFEQFYGFKPFGDYVRNLNNDGHDLVLSDGYGNVIDRVNYSDRGDWPASADGGGAFLELKDLTLDNGLATSWRASTDCVFLVGKPLVSDLYLCLNEATTAFEFTGFPGTTLKWYEDEAGKIPLNGTPVPSSASIGNKDYFVTTYTVTGCESKTAKVTVSVSEKPAAAAINADVTNPSMPKLESVEGPGYQWFLYGIRIPGATSKIYEPYQDGIYQVALVNNGCEGFLSLPYDLIITSIDDEFYEFTPVVSPNPVNNILNIRFKDRSFSDYKISIHDISGRQLNHYTGNGRDAELNMTELSPGTYILNIGRMGKLFTFKVIKSRP